MNGPPDGPTPRPRAHLPEWAWLGIVFLLLGVLAWKSWSSLPPGAMPSAAAPAPRATPHLQADHLPTIVSRIQRDNPDSLDESVTVYASDRASVHMHMIGAHQICPLHLHRTTHEATLIVTGEPEVEIDSAGTEAPTRWRERVAPGTLLSTGPGCAHEWSNPGSTMQGNLIFAYPAFDGNLYVRSDDPRLLDAPAPYVARPALGLTRFLEGTEPFTQEVLPVLEGRLSTWFVRSETTLPVRTDVDSVVYVLAGRGQIEQGLSRPIEPGTAAAFLRQEPTRIVATEPLAFLLFEPPSARDPDAGTGRR